MAGVDAAAGDAEEQRGDRTAERRETGADDREVGFHDSPHRAGDRVPGGVQVVSGNVESGDAENGGDADASGETRVSAGLVEAVG